MILKMAPFKKFERIAYKRYHFKYLFSAGMALSPGSSINTPGQAQPNPSPLAQPSPEEQAYRDKIRHLSKYIEPLRRMIANMRGGDVRNKQT